MFLGSRCPLCGEHQGAPCDRCIASLPAAPPLGSLDGLERCVSLMSYHGAGKALVTSLKFKNQRILVPWVAERMADALRHDSIDLVTWAPTSRHHRRLRGFDQAEVCAHRLAKSLGVPAARTLVRLSGPAQTGRHRDERWHGPRFDTPRGIVGHVAGKRIALVDDVVTTGATMTRAGNVLVAWGATGVIGVAIARTPRVGGPRRDHRNQQVALGTKQY